MSEEDFWETWDGYIRLFEHKPYDDDTSSMAPMLRVAEALADLDTKRNEDGSAIENNDWLLQVEALKSLGDLYLQIGKKTRDECKVCFAINLYLNALRHCRDNCGKITLYHRVSHATKYIAPPPLPSIPHDRVIKTDVTKNTFMSRLVERLRDLDRQNQEDDGISIVKTCPMCKVTKVATFMFKDIVAVRDVNEDSEERVARTFEDLDRKKQQDDEIAIVKRYPMCMVTRVATSMGKDIVAEMYRDVSEDINTCMLRVAGMLKNVDRQKEQGCNEDTLIEGYTMMMVRAALYTDAVGEVEALKSIGDIYLERGKAQKNTKDLCKALALYNSALKIYINEASSDALQHRIEYARKAIRRVEKGKNVLKIPKTEVKQERETEQRSYAELLLAADTALQKGDLDASESHYASALQQAHDRESPKLKKEEECLRKLGDVYVRRGEQTKDGQDFAKATALYNAALARNGDKQILTHSIKEAERLFLYHTVGIDCKPAPYETDIQHKTRLEKYRTEVKARLDTIHKNHNPYQYDEDDPLVKKVERKRAEAVRNLFKDIARQRKDFIKDLVDKCIKTIGQPPCQYAMVGLGSQATELVTPYSDLEFAILIEENKDTPENKGYFLNLTCYLYLKIINLGETILPAVAIKSLNDFHSEDPADSWFYDSVTPRGFAFDGAMPWASKTPFGREKTRSKPAVSLIQTPAGMAEFQRHDIALRHGYHLSSILRYVCYLTGDQTLVDDYMARVIKELDTCDAHNKSTAAVRFARASLNLAMQERSWGEGITDKPLNVKREIYRFPVVAVVNLGLFWNVYATSVWGVIEEMEEAGVITKENAHHLQVLVSISGELRLRTYFKLGGQKEKLSGLSAMQKQEDDSGEALLKSVFHVPDHRMLFRYYYTARPLKTYIKGISPVIAKRELGRETFYDASPLVKANIHQGLLQFNAAISYLEGALEELDEEKVAGTRLPVSLLGQQAKCYFGLVDHRKAISRWEEQLSLQQQIHEYDSKSIVRTYQNLARSWARIGNEEKFLEYFKQAAALTYKYPVDLAEIANLLSITGLTEYIDRDYEGKTILNSINEANLNNMLRTELKENSARTDVAVQLLNLGERFNHLGDYTKAITYTEESLKMMKTIYGQDTAHPLIAAALTNLGRSLCRGRHDHVKAVRCYQEALDINKLVDTPHPVTVDILRSLGDEWLHLGDHKNAHGCLEKALQMAKTIHGGEACHPDIARALNNLGHFWGVSRDNKKALEFFEQALKMNRELQGQNTSHPETACTLANMAGAMANSGNNSTAVHLLVEALEMLDSLGLLDKMKRPDLALGLGNLGLACCLTGEHEKALKYCERALEISKGTYGQNAAHPAIATSLSNLATVYKELGEHTKATQLFQQSLNMMKISHGRNETHEEDEVRHPDIARALNNLGQLCDISGDNERALVFCEQALKMNRELHGQNTPHPETACTLANMAGAMANSGNNSTAVHLLVEALEMLDSLGLLDKMKRPDLALGLGNVGLACCLTGEHEKALKYCERALEISKGIHGQNAAHPAIATSLSNLATVYKELGEHTKATQLFQQSLNMMKISHGRNETHEEDEVRHPDIARALDNLGQLCDISGDNERALVFCEQALKMNRELHGQNTPHPETACSLANMARAMEKSGNNSKAISLFKEALEMMDALGLLDKMKDPDPLSNIGLAWRMIGEHEKSLKYLERAMEICKGIHGQEAAHPSIATTLSNLAAVRQALGDYSKAIQLYKDALDMLKVIHGANGTHGGKEPRHPDIADSLRNLANTHKDLGNYTKAIQLYEEELNMRKTIHGSSETHSGDEVCHPDIAHALNNLGLVWGITGDNEKAREFFEQALKMYRTLHGQTTPHLHTALVLENVGNTWEKSGDNVKAISYYEEALKIMEDVWGKSTAHPNIAKVVGNLGSACRKAGKHTKSLQYYKWELEINKSIHGQEAAHPSIADSLRNLANAHKDLGNYPEAIKIYEDELIMRKTIHRDASETHSGDEVCHPDIAHALNNLGLVWDDSGDNEKAREFYEQALKMYRTLHGPDTPHHDTALVLENVGNTWGRSGDNVKAIRYYEEALKMMEEVWGKSTAHPNIAKVLGNLRGACRKAGEHTKCLHYYDRALEINKAIHGQEAAHPSITDSLRNLANTEKDLGNYSKAIQLYEEELNMRRKIHSSSETHSGDGACHPDIAHALNNLGLVWSISGDNEKARELFEQALKMYRALHGQTTPHPDTALVLENVGHTWEISGDNVKAIRYYEEALKMMEDVWGKSTAHPNIAKVLRTLGSACCKEGKHTKSRRYYERALKINKSIHGQEAAHPSIADSLRSLANANKDLGNCTIAIQLYEEELNMRKTIHSSSELQSGNGGCHPDIAHALKNLGLVWDDSGDNEKAREFYEQALKMFQTLRGQTTPHPHTAWLLEIVGITWEKSGDNVKAIRYYEEALKMMEEVWGKSTAHPNITKVEGSLRRAYGKAERHFPKESLRHYMLILRLNKRIHGEDAVHPSIAETLSNLAGVYEALGDHTKAIQLFQEALNMMKIIHEWDRTESRAATP
ncbi:hypothetical protein Bbelb_306930 [Branchiostoma belcheri]|nr:hypothetical protein Bbelb_306930 [Branchiostoma belcheri]